MNGTPASVLSNEGWAAWNKRDGRTALSKFQAALAKDSENEIAQNGLGQSLLMQGNLDEAERVLLKATEDVIAEWGEAKAAQEGVAAWYGLVRTYMQKKDYQNARKWIERYLKHEPGDQTTMNAMLNEIAAEEATESGEATE